MKKFFLTKTILYAFVYIASGQLIIDTNKTAFELVNIFKGSGIQQISNPVFTNTYSVKTVGYFSNGNSTNLGFDEGIVLATGKVTNVASNASNLMSFNVSLINDTLLNSISGVPTYDVSFLEFDVVPLRNTLEMELIYASEEYPEFVCSQGIIDALGVFITGEYPVNNMMNNVNIAQIPGTNINISIHSINNGTPGQSGDTSHCVSLNYSYLYVDNTNGNYIVFDGFTVPIKIITPVIPGKIYHLRIAIGDGSDQAFDSGVFLKAGSLRSISSLNTFCNSSTSLCLETPETYNLPVNLSAEQGPNYDCITMTPRNPMWFHFQTVNDGKIVLSFNSQSDIDFVCWGPFDDPYLACQGMLTSANVVGCSFATGNGDLLTINNAPAFKYYVLMLSSYSNITGTVTITQQNAQMPDAAHLNCGTALPIIDSVQVQVSNCDSLNQYTLSGNVYVAYAPTNGNLRITDMGSSTYTLVPLTGAYTYNYSLQVPFSSSPSQLKVSIDNYISETIVDYNPPKRPDILVNKSNSSCGQQNGYILVGITGNGIPNYSYYWSSGQSTVNTPTTSNYLQQLGAGLYTVSVYNANHCYSTETITINDVGASTISISQTADNNCLYSCTAQLHAVANGTNYPYTYVWNTSQQFIDNQGQGSTISDLCNGVYSVTVTDINGCSSVALYEIMPLHNPQIMVSNIVYPTCSNTTNGSITISLVGDTALLYSWSTYPVQNGPTATNLAPGQYSCIITTTSGCTITDTIYLTSLSNMNVTSILNHPHCAGDGSIEIIVQNGFPPYTYLWHGFSNNNTPYLNNLNPGTYILTVFDSLDCSISNSFVLNDYTFKVDSFNTTPACLYSMGTVQLYLSGGNPPYYYNGNVVNNPVILTNVTPGQHTFTFTDSHNCTINKTVEIDTVSAFNFTANISNSSCNLNDGSIEVQLLNAITPVSYYWSDGQQTLNTNSLTENRYNLPAGAYYLTVIQGNGCKLDTFLVVNDNSNLQLYVDSMVSPTCYGGNDGCIYIHAEGGIAPYNYLWSNGSQQNYVCNLQAGHYIITVSDAANCSNIAVVTLSDGYLPVAAFTYIDSSTIVQFINQSTQGAYLWNFGDGTISTEVNPIHYYISSGIYLVCLTVFHICDTVSYCQNINVNITSTQDNNLTTYILIPNPACNAIYIKSNTNETVKMIIYDMILRPVYENEVKTNTSIDISTLPYGIYTVVVFNDTRQYVKKLIISCNK